MDSCGTRASSLNVVVCLRRCRQWSIFGMGTPIFSRRAQRQGKDTADPMILSPAAVSCRATALEHRGATVWDSRPNSSRSSARDGVTARRQGRRVHASEPHDLGISHTLPRRGTTDRAGEPASTRRRIRRRRKWKTTGTPGCPCSARVDAGIKLDQPRKLDVFISMATAGCPRTA